MSINIPFDNTFARLSREFYTPQNPSPVAQPGLITVNDELARDLGIDPAALRGQEGIEVLSGNRVPEGAEPLAQVYAGHQFAGWVPRLGDGRAVLLGEVVDNTGNRRDIQLKGAGRTPYSRSGDGRAWLGPVLREYLVSEAMHAFGIPTTRALAVVTTGQEVLRETALPGAVLTRVARSHIRVGTFQYFAARQDIDTLKILTEYVIQRHYPEAATPIDLLNSVIARQAALIAQWMGVGFIHGVMNTDNMAISGETIDYGPCAFMDNYHPETVYSSIDRFGRYAYFRQPEIAVWNLAQFASCLLPLMGEKDAAIDAATTAVHNFPDIYRTEWLKVFRSKIGLTSEEEDDAVMIDGLLNWMTAKGADFTNTFRTLSQDKVPDGLEEWGQLWHERRKRDSGNAIAVMAQANPAIIPRNHLIEKAIEDAVAGDLAPFHRLCQVLKQPYQDQPDTKDLQRPPEPHEVVQRTFCGT